MYQQNWMLAFRLLFNFVRFCLTFIQSPTFILFGKFSKPYIYSLPFVSSWVVGNLWSVFYFPANSKNKFDNSILLHSGLNSGWHFWLSTKFSCFLKMKSVEDILGYILEQFHGFLWNCSRKYNKMFKTDSFLGNKKLRLNH